MALTLKFKNFMGKILEAFGIKIAVNGVRKTGDVSSCSSHLGCLLFCYRKIKDCMLIYGSLPT